MKDTISELITISKPEGWNTPLTYSLNLSNLCRSFAARTSQRQPSLRTRSSVELNVAMFRM